MIKPSNIVLEHIFKQTFFDSTNTVLVGGALEPIYIPFNFPNAHEYVGTELAKLTTNANVIFYREDFIRSAFHEIAHWCIAGESRRQQLDFGYWYESDGRSQAQQIEFQQVEIKPQAIEYAFCRASNISFRVSVDNLNGESDLSYEQLQEQECNFFEAVKKQLQEFEDRGFPQRAKTLLNVLSDYFKTSKEAQSNILVCNGIQKADKQENLTTCQ